MTCSSLQKLTANGFSLPDAMDLAETEKVKEAFRQIRVRLENGEPAGEVFPGFLPPVYRGYFSGMIRYLSFGDSLSVAVTVADEEEKGKKELIKGLVYPVLLMTGTMTGILLFSVSVLPQMLKLMQGFGLEAGGYEVMQRMILFLSCAALVLIVVICGVMIYLLQPEQIVDTYTAAARRFPDSILTQYASAEFIRFYLAFMKVSPSTFECMKVLKELKMRPLTALIAGVLDDQLNQGTSFENALHTPYIERTLLRFFRIAFHTGDANAMLEGYLAMVEERKAAQIRNLTRIIQLISYTVIGAVIVIVYRILMIPMTMIQQL